MLRFSTELIKLIAVLTSIISYNLPKTFKKINELNPKRMRYAKLKTVITNWISM